MFLLGPLGPPSILVTLLVPLGRAATAIPRGPSMVTWCGVPVPRLLSMSHLSRVILAKLPNPATFTAR